jgi:hypothetical protein
VPQAKDIVGPLGAAVGEKAAPLALVARAPGTNNKNIYNQYMEGTINSNLTVLAELIRNEIKLL